MKKTMYVSFLGAGNYNAVHYQWNGIKSVKTPYAQEAELRLLLESGQVSVKTMRVLIFGTPTSRRAHWDKQRGYNPRTGEYGDSQVPGLRPRLDGLDVEYEFVEMSEDLSAPAQWATFQELLRCIPSDTELILDMTHGFRAVPVVFSSALHFLRLTRDLTIKQVLYGAHDADPPAIMDYGDFYAIQDWTDGVSRLIEDADAGKLAALSGGGSSLPVKGFDARELTGALMSVTDAVKNVEVNGVEGKVREALGLVDASLDQARREGNVASETLLSLVKEKFAGLMSSEPLSGHYDQPYFDVQLIFMELLLEHRLFMQAFTAMREYIGSLGMRGCKPGQLKFTNSTGRGKRLHAEVFISMVSYPEPKWWFDGDRGRQMDALKPYYDQLVEAGVVKRLQELVTPLTRIRNGFDHAWTSKASVPEDIAEKGVDYLEKLRDITRAVLEILPVGADARPGRGASMLVLMNHAPTDDQKRDAQQEFDIPPTAWVLPPPPLAERWAAIDPAVRQLPEDLARALRGWLDDAGTRGDLLLVQGDPGATDWESLGPVSTVCGPSPVTHSTWRVRRPCTGYGPRQAPACPLWAATMTLCARRSGGRRRQESPSPFPPRSSGPRRIWPAGYGVTTSRATTSKPGVV